MSGRRRNLTSEEKALWKRVAKTVTTRRKPLPEDEAEEGGFIEKLGKLAPQALTYPNKPIEPPVSPKRPPAKAPAPVAKRDAEKSVRRGKIEVEAKFDLHGFTQDAGRAALIRFLHAARQNGARTALVVTGVGRTGEGVLKKRFPDWLESAELKPIVAGYAQAHRSHGGAGAFYVFLKRK